MSNDESSLLSAKLNLETALIPWQELQRFFAQGKVLYVDKEKDLIAIAELIASDNSKEISNMLNSIIKPVSDEQAKVWVASNESVWAVVVAPWVFVQPQ